MADISPTSSTQSTFATERSINRLWILTTLSLAFNGFILILILLGAVMHHHRMERGLGGPDPRDRFEDRGPGGPRDDRSFHRFDGGRFGDDRGPDPDRGPRGDNRPGERPDMDRNGPPPRMNPPDPARMSEQIMEHLSQSLSLTDDEKTKIKPIVEAQVSDIQKQMEAQRAVLQKQFEDGKAKIRPLLTADQQKQLDAMPLPGPHGPPPPDASKPPKP